MSQIEQQERIREYMRESLKAYRESKDKDDVECARAFGMMLGFRTTVAIVFGYKGAFHNEMDRMFKARDDLSQSGEELEADRGVTQS